MDSAYSEALAAARNNTFPHLLLLEYAHIPGPVVSLQAVPGAFVTPAALIQRKPLNPTARRAGWIGCDIALINLPLSARVLMVEHGHARRPTDVRAEWRQWDFLRTRDSGFRTWFNELLRRVEQLGKEEFELAEIYAFETELAKLFPQNRFIRPKIRQQLQVLRDRGFLEFRERGHYRYIARPKRRSSLLP